MNLLRSYLDSAYLVKVRPGGPRCLGGDLRPRRRKRRHEAGGAFCFAMMFGLFVNGLSAIVVSVMMRGRLAGRGVYMRRNTIRAAIVSLVFCAALVPSASRAGPDGTFVLACENGQNYPLRATAVSVTGDVVAGYLMLGHRRGAHVRLIPMGAGYRYAGLGFWVDGWRQEAVLHLGKHTAVNCTVLRGS